MLIRSIAIVLAAAGACSAAIQYTPTQDVGVRYASRAPADELRVRNNDINGYWAKSYLQFDVSSLSDTALGGSLVLHQFLELNYISDPTTLNLYAFTSDLDTFDQTSITWAIAPANDVASGSGLDPALTTLIASLAYDLGPTGVRPDGYAYTFDLNQQGIDILNTDADRRISLVLTMESPSSTFSVYADPRTDITAPLPGTTPEAYLPTLMVAVPEPMSLGGMLFASFGLLFRKRTR